ncbi:MAG: hypothetical protein AB1918_09485 [Pseudomonadota bacterium]
MKARSVVFTHVQWPFAVFGLPPKLMVFSLTAGVVVYVLTIVFGAIAVSVIAFGLTIVGALWLSYRVARTDRHVESVFLTTLAFWGSSPRRWLLAGAYPRRSRGGRS